MSEHTPTPWMVAQFHMHILPENGSGAICKFESIHGMYSNYEANAAFIVKAVNSHDALVSALTDARNALASLPMEALGYASDPMGEQIHWPIRDELLHRIDEALATIKVPS